VLPRAAQLCVLGEGSVGRAGRLIGIAVHKGLRLAGASLLVLFEQTGGTLILNLIISLLIFCYLHFSKILYIVLNII